jgi:hypothetical protein
LHLIFERTWRRIDELPLPPHPCLQRRLHIK